MPEVSPSKAELRRQLLAHRQSIPAEVRREWDSAIGRRVLAWWNANPAALLGAYWPIRSEPDLRPLYDELATRGARLALPLVAQTDAPLQFRAWQPGDALIKDSFGVMVPADGAVVHPDALLIPCVGFNAGNIRLGYGGGFYDRTLAHAARPLAIGVAYSLARCDFPGDVHDVALDDIITETSPERFTSLAR